MFFFTQRRMLLFDLIILSNNIIERDTNVKRKGKKRNVSFSRVAGTVSLGLCSARYDGSHAHITSII